jgi:acetyl esterase/lipase
MDVEPRQIVYKTPTGAPLHLHVFDPAPRSERAAAIVFFFGGGWHGGTPEQFFPHCRRLAARGMLAASAVYRTAGSHGASPFECVADGKSAVRWLRVHADELNIDPARIAAGGGSAGGHVAACTGVLKGFDEPGEDLRVSSRPSALVLFNPVIDTTETGFGAARLGGRARDLSPVHHVEPGAPPTIIFHGTADTAVPLENVERFRRAMLSAGSRCELVPFEGKAHGFFNYSRDREAYAQTVAAAEEFLASLGLLPPAA